MGSFSGGGASGLTQSSTEPVSPNAGDIWVDTDANKTFRRNDANDSWVDLRATDTDEIIITHSSTITDYTQPTAATSSSDASTESTDTLDSSTGWTLNGSASISGGVLNTGTYPTTQLTIAHRSIGMILATNWTIDFDWKTTGDNGPNSTQGIFGVSNGTDPRTNDSVWIAWGTASDVMRLYAHDGSTLSQLGTDNSSFSHNTQYYGRITKSGNTYTFTGYSDSARTVTVASISGTKTNVAGLDTYAIGSTENGGTPMSNVIIDNINPIGQSFPAGDSIDDDITNRWESNVETNPNIYADMGSSTNICGIAIYPNANTTETEIKIQTSTDGSTWIDKRTITVSNLTVGSWNYIRIHCSTARYIRVYGNSGSSKVLAISEIKVLSKTDSQVNSSHGHLSISSSNTGLGLDGT